VIALFFDTETTGFKSEKFDPEIVQIAAILQDTETRRVFGEINLIVSTDNLIPEVVVNIHGITNELSKSFGAQQIVADNMFAFLASKADVLVAHNTDFDVNIIKGTWTVSGALIADKPLFCTMKKSTNIVGISKSHGGGNKYPRLAEAYRFFFNEDFDNAHDAMADVRACRDVYFALLEANK
jgi:DNA polymerase-3 subunit epsilon